MDPLPAVIDGASGAQVNLAADPAFDVLRGLSFMDGDRVEQFGRKDAEVDGAVTAAVGRLAAVDDRIGQIGTEAADRDLRSTAVLSMRGGSGKRLERLCDGKRRNIANLVGGQAIDDRDRLPLERDRVLDVPPHARDDDLVEDHGTVGRLRLRDGRRPM